MNGFKKSSVGRSHSLIDLIMPLLSRQKPPDKFFPLPLYHAIIALKPFRRQVHTIPRPPSNISGAQQLGTQDARSRVKSASKGRRQPSYELTFTCIPCGGRSTHSITKQGYHFGSVLIACPKCRNRHVISDHLKIFGDRKVTVEELLREKGQLVKKGTLGEDGDLEFWADGSVTSRLERNKSSSNPMPKGEHSEGTVPDSMFRNTAGEQSNKSQQD